MVTAEVCTGGIGRSGGVATEDTFIPGFTVLSVDGSPKIRVENVGDASRSFVLSTRYADSDVTEDAPYRYDEAVAYWTAWLESHFGSTPAEIAA